MPKRSRSASICDGLRKTYFVHIGRGLLPLLAVMLLAAPQLAFAQNSLAVTVSPTALDFTEPESGSADKPYSVTLHSSPTEAVKITVHGASHVDARAGDAEGGIGVTGDGSHNTDTGLLDLTFAANASGPDLTQSVTVRVYEDLDAGDEEITLTHTAVIGDDETILSLRDSDVTVRVTDSDEKSVSISPTSLTFEEAKSTEFHGGTRH